MRDLRPFWELEGDVGGVRKEKKQADIEGPLKSLDGILREAARLRMKRYRQCELAPAQRKEGGAPDRVSNPKPHPFPAPHAIEERGPTAGLSPKAEAPHPTPAASAAAGIVPARSGDLTHLSPAWLEGASGVTSVAALLHPYQQAPGVSSEKNKKG